MAQGLLIVDMQVGFNPSVALIDKIRAAAERYSVVAMTRFHNPDGSLYRSVLNWHDDGRALAVEVPGAVVLEKEGYGLDDRHIEILRGKGCAEWHLAGLETDACVLACAYSLWDGGMRPVIRPELCDGPLHDEALRIAKRQFG